jgi:hypothetical protein
VAVVFDNKEQRPEAAGVVAAVGVAVAGGFVAWTDSRKAWLVGSCMLREHIGLAVLVVALLGTQASGLVHEVQLSCAPGSPTRHILEVMSIPHSGSCWVPPKIGPQTSSMGSCSLRMQYLMSLVGLAVGQTWTLEAGRIETSWDGCLVLRDVLIVVVGVVVVGTGRMPLMLVSPGRPVLAGWRWMEVNILSCRLVVAMEVHSERTGVGRGSELITYCHNFGWCGGSVVSSSRSSRQMLYNDQPVVGQVVWCCCWV